jgi:hypothetical protein
VPRAGGGGGGRLGPCLSLCSLGVLSPLSCRFGCVVAGCLVAAACCTCLLSLLLPTHSGVLVSADCEREQEHVVRTPPPPQVRAIAEAAAKRGLPHRVGSVLTTDVFYQPDSAYRERYRSAGALAVEMCVRLVDCCCSLLPVPTPCPASPALGPCARGLR